MEALEFETQVGKNGRIILPKQFQHTYGKFVRPLLLLPEQTEMPKKRRQPGSAKGILEILL